MTLLSELQFTKLENDSLRNSLKEQKKTIIELKKQLNLTTSIPKFYLEKKLNETKNPQCFYYIYNNKGGLEDVIYEGSDELALVHYRNYVNNYLPPSVEVLKETRINGQLLVFTKNKKSRINQEEKSVFTEVVYQLSTAEKILDIFFEHHYSNQKDVDDKINAIYSKWDSFLEDVNLFKVEKYITITTN
jgi:GH15 family glucan-1,4-alpha-glucosidase